MTKEKMVLGILIFLAVAILVFYTVRKHHEGFATGIAAIDILANNRDQYIELSKKKYNPFSDSMDVQRGNFMRTDDPAILAKATQDIHSALRTSDLVQTSDSATFLGVSPNAITHQMPPANNVYTEAKTCESLRTRGSCESLSDPKYKNCGVCIKGGSPYTFEKPGKHIGGLLVLPDDRTDAEEKARLNNSRVAYQSTVGECPPGFLHVDRATCEREVNRLDCKEAGETGGFDKGVTLEGKKVANEKCAQIPSAGDSVFIYEPKTRTFDMGLRVLTPSGTGICKVYVYNSSGKQVGFNSSDVPGKDFVVNIRTVKEGDALSVVVAMEGLHRPKGQSEVYQISSGYDQTQDSARNVCERNGSTQASESQLVDAWQNGAQACSAGWGSDFHGWPAQARENSGGCGTNQALNDWIPEDNKAAAWCYGIKPPQSIKTTLIPGSILHWFGTYGENSAPSQADMPSQWSRYGDYQAPAFRGVLLQWEMANGSTSRVIPFQPTIVGVDGMGPSSSLGGSLTFKNLTLSGTFGGSKIIVSPKPSGNSQMLRNQFWLWGGNHLSQQVKFDVKVPGVFLDPYYKEDMVTAPRGTLVGNPVTLALLKTSPCLQDGQTSGAYSTACLNNLFVGAGGDLYNGKIATKGGVSQLNSLGDMDAISSYLNGLFTIATTGKDSDGNSADLETINDAAQQMFGFDIASPCEDITQDAAGNIVVVPKTTPVDAKCLNYLWLNTFSDKSRGEEGGRRGLVKNTYTTIADRYSGLRYNEGSKDSRKESPFQACQRTGTKAPIGLNGTVNTKNVMEANTKGSLEAIQNFYDGIHKAANYKDGSSTQSTAHAAAVQQCYGIDKSGPKYPTTGCFSPLNTENGNLIEVTEPMDTINLIEGPTYVSDYAFIKEIDDATTNYELSFYITLKGIKDEWNNIVNFQNTKTYSHGSIGSCMPGVYIRSNGRIWVTIGTTNDYGFGVQSPVQLPMNVRTKITIMCIGNCISLGMEGVGEWYFKQENERPRPIGGKLYVYSSLNVSPDAVIEKMKYTIFS